MVYVINTEKERERERERESWREMKRENMILIRKHM